MHYIYNFYMFLLYHDGVSFSDLIIFQNSLTHLKISDFFQSLLKQFQHDLQPYQSKKNLPFLQIFLFNHQLVLDLLSTIFDYLEIENQLFFEICQVALGHLVQPKIKIHLVNLCRFYIQNCRLRLTYLFLNAPVLRGLRSFGAFRNLSSAFSICGSSLYPCIFNFLDFLSLVLHVYPQLYEAYFYFHQVFKLQMLTNER